MVKNMFFSYRQLEHSLTSELFLRIKPCNLLSKILSEIVGSFNSVGTLFHVLAPW